MGCSTTPCHLPNNLDFNPSSWHQFPNDPKSSPSTRSTQARILLYSPAPNSTNFLICPRMVCREYIQYGAGTAPCRAFTWESIPTGTYIVRRIHKWGLRGIFFSDLWHQHSLSLPFLDQTLWWPKFTEFWNSSSNTKLPCPSPVKRCFFRIQSFPNRDMWFHWWLCLWRSNGYRDSKYRGMVDSHRRWPTERLKGSSTTNVLQVCTS